MSTAQVWETKREPDADDRDSTHPEPEAELLARKIEKIYDGYNIERRPLHDTWVKCLQYYRGYQWHTWDPTTARLYLDQPDKGAVRRTVNRTMDMVRTFAAKLMKQKPAIFTVPASTDENDINSARIAQRVIDGLWLTLKIKENVLQDSSVAIPLFGNGFIGVEWDFDKEDFLIESVSPFEVTVDWDAKNLDQARYILRSKVIDKDRIKEIWPDGPMCKTKMAVSSRPPASNQIMSIGDPFATERYGTGAQVADRERAMIHYYYERPCREYPEGRRAVICDGDVYEMGPNDLLPGGDLPFIHIRDILSPDLFWAQGTTEHFVEQQYAFNKTRSMIMKSIWLSVSSKILVPRGSPAESDEYFTNKELEKIPFDPGSEPHYLNPPSVSGDAIAELGRIISDMEAISGQHEVTRTSAPPPNVESGIAIQQLLEMDESRMAAVFSSWEAGIERLAKMMLEIAKTHYPDQKTLSIIGQNMEIEFIDFKGADLYGNYDVRVQSGSSLPQSKTARQQLLLEMHKNGLLEDKAMVLRLLDIGQMPEYWDETYRDVHRAKLENRLILQEGRWFAPNDYDDHVTHIREHNKERKSDAYLMAPKDRQKLMSDHVNVHGLLLMQSLNAVEPNAEPRGREAAPQEGGPNA